MACCEDDEDLGELTEDGVGKKVVGECLARVAEEADDAGEVDADVEEEADEMDMDMATQMNARQRKKVCSRRGEWE